MLNSVLLTESRDKHTEALLGNAEREKKKRTYKRVPKVIEQEPTSLGKQSCH